VKAVQIEEFGGPEGLKTVEIPTLRAREDEVLIELRASGVNRSDILTRSGSYHAAGQPPIVLGFEGSGIVREPGPAATGISSGDRFSPSTAGLASMLSTSLCQHATL
jgi:NADPH:quinone reductase